MATKKRAQSTKAKPRERSTTPEFGVETVRFAGMSVPIMRRKDGSTPYRSKAECDAMSGVVARYRDIRRRGRGTGDGR